MMKARWRFLVWLTLLAFLVVSCTTIANVRPEDYGRIEPDETYHVITVDSVDYEVKNLTVTDSVATFTHNGETKSLAMSNVRQIQQVNNHAILKTGIGVGAALALTVGLVVLLKPD